MAPIRTIEHTADIGIEVSGGSLRELFINAAKGMVGLMVSVAESKGLKGHPSTDVREISLEAVMGEQLLVEWLEELNYLFEVRRLIPIKFHIRSISDNGLDAMVTSIPFDPELHRPGYQIKAVTYHNLSIVEEKGVYKARIIFDI